MTASVLVTHDLPAGMNEELDRDWDVWSGSGPIPRPLLLAGVSECDGLLCMLVDEIDEELIVAGSGKLRGISQMSVGVDNVDLAAATRHGIPVGHTPGVLTETTADTAFALLGAAVRRLVEGRQALLAGKVGEWDPDFLLGGDLWGTTIGIIGLGRIGEAIGRRAVGFGMRVLYASRSPKEPGYPAEWVPVDRLITESDHVVLAAPLTAATTRMIDGPALASMKDGATLVNIARGGLVDHSALTAEARRGRLRIALDVTEPEPLPSDHPLLHLPNVLVVPHLGSASVRTRTAMARMAIRNLQLALDGRPMEACANPEVYRR